MKTVRGTREDVTYIETPIMSTLPGVMSPGGGGSEAPRWGAAALIGGVLFLFAASGLAVVLGGWSS